MPVQLNTSNIGQNTSPKVANASNTLIHRTRRVKDDLDRFFIEADTQAKAKFLNLPYIDLFGFPIDTAHLNYILKGRVEKIQMGVFTVKNKEVYVATPSPNNEGQSEFLMELAAKGLTHKIFLCSHLSLNKILSTYNYLVEVAEVNDNIDISKASMDKTAGNKNSLSELASELMSLSTSQIVESILIAALQNNASDIHFEPEKTEYNLRLRLDGVLHTFAHLPKDSQKGIESRLKVISGLKLNVDNVPQDGRFSFKANDKDIDVRVSMLPSNYGYSVVMRLLGTGSVALQLENLGFTGLAKKRVETAISKPQGLILTTGPTGSGKTTTLYTFLSDLNDGESKIITLEDPIEYKLTGISQTQIDAKAGYTFASGLRSILRQDPDIVMVGEIRDAETAEIAVQASLTGHQVLSTIHTNDAAGSIPRLMEMGLKGFLLADSLAAIIGQRLVRRLCPQCQVNDPLDEDQKHVVIEQLNKLPKNAEIKIKKPLVFKTCTGCDFCNHLGYKGRVGIYEVLVVTDGLRTLISAKEPSIVEVRDIASQEGMVTMLQDGLLKALDGLTDVKELLKNAG
jgi:type IV pilus assembly protein PilB